MVAREMASRPDAGHTVVGFLDDDASKLGTTTAGLPVLGRVGDLVAVVAEHGVDEIVIAIPSAPGRTVRDVVRLCEEAGCPFKIVPGVWEILLGDVEISQIRDVELNDLLGRETVQLDTEEMTGYLRGRRVLITGAGGSIGSELARQVAAFEPGQARAARPRREQHLRDRPGARHRLPRPGQGRGHRERQGRHGDRAPVQGAQARDRSARRRAQARAPHGVLPGRGHQEQRHRDEAARGRRDQVRRGPAHHALDRQGGEAAGRHGGVEEARRARPPRRRPGAAAAPSSSPSASGTSSEAAAAWSPCSGSRSRWAAP